MRKSAGEGQKLKYQSADCCTHGRGKNKSAPIILGSVFNVNCSRLSICCDDVSDCVCVCVTVFDTYRPDHSANGLHSDVSFTARLREFPSLRSKFYGCAEGRHPVGPWSIEALSSCAQREHLMQCNFKTHSGPLWARTVLLLVVHSAYGVG